MPEPLAARDELVDLIKSEDPSLRGTAEWYVDRMLQHPGVVLRALGGKHQYDFHDSLLFPDVHGSLCERWDFPVETAEIVSEGAVEDQAAANPSDTAQSDGALS